MSASTFVVVAPEYITITPSSSSVAFNETVTLTSNYNDGSVCNAHWYIADEQVASNQSTYSPSFSSAGEYTVTAKWSYYPLIETTAVITVNDNGGSTPEPSGDWVTNDQMDASQNAQTLTIVNSIKSESTLIQAAIKSLETTLSNSQIYQLFTQSFTFYNFDFATGQLSTTGVTLNGFVPTFNYWAQNVEKYLGMLVDVRASEVEEEVKEETSGFWDILLGFFKPKDNGDEATANTDDMNTILGIGDDVQGYFDAGGNIGDIDSIINSDDTWAWFGDEVAADIDSVPVTYSRSAPVIEDYYSKAYSDFYSNVLGREWSGN